jgi:hypothetical protein
LAAAKELLGDAASDEKEKDFKNSMIEMLCGFDSDIIAAFMKIFYNRNSSIKSFIFLLFLNLLFLYYKIVICIKHITWHRPAKNHPHQCPLQIKFKYQRAISSI